MNNWPFNIQVRFYKPGYGDTDLATGADWAKWQVIPRVGDTIMDMRELPYKVLGVEWWGPWDVRIFVERKLHGT